MFSAILCFVSFPLLRPDAGEIVIRAHCFLVCYSLRCWTGLGDGMGMNRFYSFYGILACVLCQWDLTLFPLWALLEDADVWVSLWGVLWRGIVG